MTPTNSNSGINAFIQRYAKYTVVLCFCYVPSVYEKIYVDMQKVTKLETMLKKSCVWELSPRVGTFISYTGSMPGNMKHFMSAN